MCATAGKDFKVLDS